MRVAVRKAVRVGGISGGAVEEVNSIERSCEEGGCYIPAVRWCRNE